MEWGPNIHIGFHRPLSNEVRKVSKGQEENIMTGTQLFAYDSPG